MYLEFYGLREMPFNVTPDPKFLFLSPTHQEALSHLRYGIAEKKGFIVLTGEVGCGKTTLCRALLQELDAAEYETAVILNPRLSEAAMARAILQELGEEVRAEDKDDLLRALYDSLLERILAGKEIILLIDEAQNLDFQTLEYIRLISNLESDAQKLLQIVLVGQPELRKKLEDKRLRQLRQRVQVTCWLKPLGYEETVYFIQHRLVCAGGSGLPTFTRRALKSIHARANGIPRMINNLCDKALLSAYVRSATTVTWWDVRRGARELTIR